MHFLYLPLFNIPTLFLDYFYALSIATKICFLDKEKSVASVVRLYKIAGGYRVISEQDMLNRLHMVNILLKRKERNLLSTF